MAEEAKNSIETKIARNEFGSEISEVYLIEDGLIHQTYSVRVEESEYILQISDRKESREKALERKVYAFALAGKTQLPVPDLVTQVKSFEGRKYYIAEKLPGKSLREDYTPDLVPEIGKQLADIHNLQSFEKAGHLIPENGSLKLSRFEEADLKNWILDQVKENTEILRKSGFGEIAKQIQRFFEEHGEKIPSDFEPVLCHNDYSPDNILAQNGEITGIIDFDYVYSSHNQRDLVKSANSFWLEGYNVRKKLYSGYNQKEDLDGFDKNEPLYRLETLTEIISSIFELKENISKKEKQRYRKMLEETIDYSQEFFSGKSS